MHKGEIDYEVFSKLFHLEEKDRWKILKNPQIFFFKKKDTIAFSCKSGYIAFDTYMGKILERNGITDIIEIKDLEQKVQRIRLIAEKMGKDIIGLNDLFNLICLDELAMDNTIQWIQFSEKNKNIKNEMKIVNYLEKIRKEDRNTWEILIYTIFFRKVVQEQLLYLSDWIEFQKEEILIRFQ